MFDACGVGKIMYKNLCQSDYRKAFIVMALHYNSYPGKHVLHHAAFGKRKTLQHNVCVKHCSLNSSSIVMRLFNRCGTLSFHGKLLGRGKIIMGQYLANMALVVSLSLIHI